MKIIIPVLSIENHGGTRDLIEVANYLSNTGHTVVFYAPFDRINTHYRINPSIYIKKVPITGKTVWGLLRILNWYTFHLEPADLYVANFFPTFYPLFIRSIIKGKRFVYFVQDIEYRFVRFPLNILALFTYLLPSRKIALSSFIKEIIGGKNTEVARAGVSNIFIEKQSIERTFKNTPLTIGHIVRKEPMKNSKLFLKAIPELKRQGYEILLVGNSRKLQDIKGVKVIPFGNSEYLRDNFYDKIDIFVHTSSIEGFGLPPLEAMARGCVVLLTDSGGVREYVKDGKNAIFIDKQDLKDFINKIGTLNTNRDVMRELSRNALKEAINHPLKRLGEEFVKALSNLNLMF